jgi:hypothetical protein
VVGSGVDSSTTLNNTELWARLKRLDSTCIIHLSREAPYHVRWRGYKRIWRVAIRPEKGMAYESVAHEHLSFWEAVRLAVEDVEAKDWATRR